LFSRAVWSETGAGRLILERAVALPFSNSFARNPAGNDGIGVNCGAVDLHQMGATPSCWKSRICNCLWKSGNLNCST
jgi:hypothetical protein